MKRRDFIKAVIAGAALPLLKGKTPGDFNAIEAYGEDPYKITWNSLKAFGLKNVASRGDVVLVKPNIGWDRRPEQAANTNPMVVKAIIEAAYQAGAKKVLVLDNPCNAAKRTYYRSGIAKVAREAGAQVIFLRDSHLVNEKINGEFLNEWKVYRQALEVDRIIDAPIVKHHSLARATIGMKNLMGLIGGQRGYLHRHIDTAIVDLTQFFKPSLVVVDAYRVLKAHGPQGGSLKDVVLKKKVFVTGDIVAADYWGAKLLGLSPEQMKWIFEGEKRGLGRKEARILKI